MVATAQKEIALYVSLNTFLDAKDKGAPLAWVIPQDGYAALPVPLGLAAKAARPEAAKLMLAYLFSPEAQALMAKSGLPGAMPGSPGVDGYPEVAKAPRHVMSYKFLNDDYVPMLANNKKIFGN